MTLITQGVSEEVVRTISAEKKEPEWMLELRLKGLAAFSRLKLPKWGPDLSAIDVQSLTSYRKVASVVEQWKDVPAEIRGAFGGLAASEKNLAAAGAQCESEAVYHRLRDELAGRGVIFTDFDSAVQKHPGIVRAFLSKLVPHDDNIFAALNTALCSGGSFVFVPEGVCVEMPVHAFFRMNERRLGQFERTLIIVEKGASLHYMEGCTALEHGSPSLHAAVVEVFALEGSRMRYTTLQRWSNDVYNLVTKRARCDADAVVEWIDGNIGSRTTMKYPCVILAGKNAKADILSLSFASQGQHQDCGAKIIHAAPHTMSNVLAKSVCTNGGRASFRSVVEVAKGCNGSVSHIKCDSLMLDNRSRSDSYPLIRAAENATVLHEATAGKIAEDSLLYLMQRGLSREDAVSLAVTGFVAPLTKALPPEYAVELDRILEAAC
jgi:Fe-S cluster assembly protein SufB